MFNNKQKQAYSDIKIQYNLLFAVVSLMKMAHLFYIHAKNFAFSNGRK